MDIPLETLARVAAIGVIATVCMDAWLADRQAVQAERCVLRQTVDESLCRCFLFDAGEVLNLHFMLLRGRPKAFEEGGELQLAEQVGQLLVMWRFDQI